MANQRLKRVLLVDDSMSTNFHHETILKDLDCTDQIEICLNGLEALDYLKTKHDEGYPKPDIIFLDINMPKMNGWEFLTEYEKLPDFQKGEILLVMLTTSVNPDDKLRADRLSVIKDWISKPLTEEVVKNILVTHFNWEF